MNSLSVILMNESNKGGPRVVCMAICKILPNWMTVTL